MHTHWGGVEAEGEILVEDTLEVEANQVQINATNFPDENFRKYIKENFDKNNDDIVDDIENVTSIDVSWCGIYSLKGIEFFWALEELDCHSNNLTSLDVSKCTALKDFRCHSNNLTSLDVSKNTALGHLVCGNNELTSLDVSKNTALGSLYCDYNKLASLDMSKNTALRVLLCYNNELTSLDVSKNATLKILECEYNKLTSLDVSKNTELTRLYCYNNELASLDMSKNTELTRLYCYNNELASLDMSKNTKLTRLSCDNNKLTSLDVSKNTALEELWCRENELTSLDVSKNTALKILWCNYNQPTSLNVGKNTALKNLNIDSNITTDISFLDLSHLDIYVPQFKGTIDLSNITGIEKYMSGSGWNSNTKKLTYEMDYDILNVCTVGKNTRLVCYAMGRFSSYQGYDFSKDAYGDIRCYDSNGDPVIDEFKCDGTYTYYFQADGTAMRNRLTYHPDGKHVIYFDEDGHEVFSNFHHVEKSIAGDAVDDLCFFDVYGYMYVDVMTYDQAGEKLYYVNPYGVIEQNKWFEFSDTCVWAGTTNKVGKGYGYANADGTLMVNTHTYDWRGNFVYLQGDGHMR
ncbi:MAG: hypothetical protein NC393_08655 [Clostridium sp.]|nr:hypothetical protein [Clostridium sp.]